MGHWLKEYTESLCNQPYCTHENKNIKIFEYITITVIATNNKQEILKSAAIDIYRSVCAADVSFYLRGKHCIFFEATAFFRTGLKRFPHKTAEIVQIVNKFSRTA